MSEQAVDDKDKELQAICAALESANSEAVMDVELVREEERQKRNELECGLRETRVWNYKIKGCTRAWRKAV